MSNLPSSLALTSIASDAEIISSDHRNNYAAIQAAVNDLITALSGGSAGQLLQALSSSSVGWVGDYADFTPVVTGSTSGGGVGNGTVVSRYTQIGKAVHWYGQWTWGTTSSWGSGTGQMTLPVPMAVPYGGQQVMGHCWGISPSSGQFPGYVAYVSAAGVGFTFTQTYGGTGAFANGGAASPFVWGNSAVLRWNCTYEAA